MPHFVVRYSRTYERTVESDTLEEAAMRAKNVCEAVVDSKLIAVWDPSKPRPAEIL